MVRTAWTTGGVENAEIPLETNEYIYVPDVTWVDPATGDTLDPTLTTVEFAFVPVEVDDPDPSTLVWYPGDWEPPAPTPTARCPIGDTGGVVLSRGVYRVKVRFGDADAKHPVRDPGKLVIT